MSALGDWGQMEYSTLMARGRDAERTSLLCWTASGLAAAVLFSWGLAARNSALMLPVVFAVAFGFGSLVHARQQVRLIAGYVREFFESRDSGTQWFTRLGHLEAIPGFNPSGDWAAATLANACILAAVLFAWLFASTTPRGDLMAAIVTGFGIAFGFHSISETTKLRQTNPGTFWHQVQSGPVVEPRPMRAHGR